MARMVMIKAAETKAAKRPLKLTRLREIREKKPRMLSGPSGCQNGGRFF